METTNVGYSLKYIGKAQKMRYLLQLTENMELVIKRMRWKALCNGEMDTSNVKAE